MKASQNTLDSLANIEQVQTLGDIRRIMGQSLLALARKEISATDIVAMAKAVDAISNSLNAEISLARTAHDLRESGSALSKSVQLGRTLIGSEMQADKPDSLT